MWDLLEILSRLAILPMLGSLVVLFTEPKHAVTCVWVFGISAAVSLLIRGTVRLAHPIILQGRANRLASNIKELQATAEKMRTTNPGRYSRTMYLLADAERYTHREWAPFGCSPQDLSNFIDEGFEKLEEARRELQPE